MKKSIALLALVTATALASTAVVAQTTAQPKGPAAAAGETSDRTPEQETEAPLTQKDAYKGKTSDRSPDAKEAPTPRAGGVQPDHEGTPGGMPEKSK